MKKKIKKVKNKTNVNSVFEIQCKSDNEDWKTFHKPDDLQAAQAALAWNQDNARMAKTGKEFRILQDGEVI